MTRHLTIRVVTPAFHPKLVGPNILYLSILLPLISNPSWTWLFWTNVCHEYMTLRSSFPLAQPIVCATLHCRNPRKSRAQLAKNLSWRLRPLTTTPTEPLLRIYLNKLMINGQDRSNHFSTASQYVGISLVTRPRFLKSVRFLADTEQALPSVLARKPEKANELQWLPYRRVGYLSYRKPAAPPFQHRRSDQ